MPIVLMVSDVVEGSPVTYFFGQIFKLTPINIGSYEKNSIDKSTLSFLK